MYSSVYTFCGGYCGACPIFMKTVNGTLNELATEPGAPVEDLACFGCKSDQVAKVWCSTCFIKTCCTEKGHDTCIECETYPCPELTRFNNDQDHPYHKEHAHLLEIIKNKGIDEWLKTCRTRWACPYCQTPYNWDQDTCNNCGKPVDGYAVK